MSTELNDIAGLSKRLEDTFIVSGGDTHKRMIFTSGADSLDVDQLLVDPSQLRWVGTEFVYFLDIPWVHDLHHRFLGPSHETADLQVDISMCGLTFGLLGSVMNTMVPADSLLARGKMNQLVISGDNLSRLIVPWARNILRRDTDPSEDSTHRQWGERVKCLLVKVISALDHAIYATNGSLLDTGPDAEMTCALATFLVSFSRCAKAVWGEDAAFDFLEARTRMYGEVTYILRGKIGETWKERSAYEMERLLGGGIPFAAYATACQPTLTRVETVDTGTYVPQHVLPDCHCSFVRPDINTVREVLSRREIPVVAFDGSGSGLDVRAASEGPYVAISHVWADGLGSTTEEGLPRCQVERLSALASRLVPHCAIWQDGLCIPGEKVARQRAIGRMAATYANADKVLVIDGGVRMQCSLRSPLEECLLRIATSGWMQRIWTLQEGMLARELFFEVADGLIDCTHFNGAPSYIASRLIPLLQYRRTDMSSLEFQQRLASPPRCTVNDLIALLRYRTTSHPEDEPIAISGLLGVDTAEIVRFDGREERMRALLVRARELPRQLAVFGWFCGRLSLPNFTWAPASLSEVLWPGDNDDPLVATCTEEGLFGEYTVVRFPEVAMGENCGVIATITEDIDIAGPGETRPRCTRAGCASRVFNLVLSPYFFRVLPRSQMGMLVFNGFLLKSRSLPESMREEGVGVVRVLTDMKRRASSGESNASPVQCQFVAAGSARWGMPDTVETTRSRGHWHFVNATIEVQRLIRVT